MAMAWGSGGPGVTPVAWGAGGVGGAKNGATTNAHLFFRTLRDEAPGLAPLAREGAAAGEAAPSFDVVAMGLNDPLNIGSVFRLMGCFGGTKFTHCHIGRRRAEQDSGSAIDSGSDPAPPSSALPAPCATPPDLTAGHRDALDRMYAETVAITDQVLALRKSVEEAQRRTDMIGHNLHKKGYTLPRDFWRGGNNASSAFWRFPEILAVIKTTAVGTEKFFHPFETVHVSNFIERMRAPVRPPLVFIETATSAVSLNDFKFPAVCTVVVGSEESGVPPKVLAAARHGYDSIVYIPMPGPHPSLNVATALTCALFEFRKQWPI